MKKPMKTAIKTPMMKAKTVKSDTGHRTMKKVSMKKTWY